MNIFLQSFIGHINFALPIAVVYYYFPDFVLSLSGAVFFGIMTGAYIVWLHYSQSSELIKRLQFAPSGSAAEYFNKQVVAAGLNPQNVILRYGYNDDQIGVTVFNAVILDQMLWKGIDDPEFIKAQEVVKTHILPTLSAAKKRQLAQINEVLTEPVQRLGLK